MLLVLTVMRRVVVVPVERIRLQRNLVVLVAQGK
jgi:hypothetical protein